MEKIILATKNRQKTYEFQSIFANSYEIADLITMDYRDEIIEDGNSFIENALIKCTQIYKVTGLPVLADDSGLMVRALHGAPGIYSARYGGEGLSDTDRYELLLENMKHTEDRKAGYICALVMYYSPERIYIVQEECAGEITKAPSGTGGFGYDPVFFMKEYGKTMAELTSDEKNAVSHRGKAARAIRKLL